MLGSFAIQTVDINVWFWTFAVDPVQSGAEGGTIMVGSTATEEVRLVRQVGPMKEQDHDR
ncbi:MAG: hypothetical protein OEW83_10380 [Acidimicrobiia bacterium]|nr:hypothetical protein [Acidimicrobiia bacterium]